MCCYVELCVFAAMGVVICTAFFAELVAFVCFIDALSSIIIIACTGLGYCFGNGYGCVLV